MYACRVLQCLIQVCLQGGAKPVRCEPTRPANKKLKARSYAKAIIDVTCAGTLSVAAWAFGSYPVLSYGDEGHGALHAATER